MFSTHVIYMCSKEIQKGGKEMVTILQWGKERSICYLTLEQKHVLIDNEYLMNLDERGVVKNGIYS